MLIKIKKWLFGKYQFLTYTILSLAIPFSEALAHGVTLGDKGFIQESSGVMFFEFLYLGAKHMITGYDHILFLFGIIFFLFKMKDVAIYVSIFAISHVTTLILGVYFDLPINAYIIDAIIGLSVVYKGFDNIGGFSRMGIDINTKLAVGVFGLFHGLGLASKFIDYDIAKEGLLLNLLSFNLGVEVGQILALFILLIVMGYWRYSMKFNNSAYIVNVIMITAGFVLMGYQIAGYIIN